MISTYVRFVQYWFYWLVRVVFITGHVHAQCAKSSLIRKYLLV